MAKNQNQIKSIILLPIRYTFMLGLLTYHWFLKVWQVATAPLEPLAEEARKVPESDVSVRGIIHTLIQAALQVWLLGLHYVKVAVDYFLSPVSGLLSSIKEKLDIPETYGKKAMD